MAERVIDDLTLMMLDIRACCRAAARYKDPVVPGRVVTDEDYDAIIRETYSEVPEFKEELIPLIRDEIKAYSAEQLQLLNLAGFVTAGQLLDGQG